MLLHIWTPHTTLVFCILVCGETSEQPVFTTFARRFVVAEMSGSASERDALSGGVVFAPSERLAEICAYYLNRPQERAAIAERGRLMYERFSEADILRQPTEKIFLRRRKVSV